MKFREGKIVEKFFVEKDGKRLEVIFRYPKMSDVKYALKYVNSLVDEGAMVTRTQKLTLNQEIKFFKELPKKIQTHKAVYIVVEIRGKFAGMGDVKKKDEEVTKHVSVLAIGLNKEYRGLGVGKKLMHTLVDLAKKELGCELVTLTVFNKNKAKKLYKNVGFIEYGKLPKGLKRKDGYDDEVYMYKVLSK